MPDPNKQETTEEVAVSLSDIDTVAKAYAAHNRVHAEYVDARWGARRKLTMQEAHEAIVRKIFDLGGKHLPKGEALDDTLPQDLREAVKARYLSNNIVLAEGDPATSTIQVLRTGTFYHPQYGKFTITVEDLETMIANFIGKKPKAPTEMVIDFEHMSVADPPVIAPAAGWVRGLSLDGEALLAAVEWTADAAEKIRKKEYRFISPEFSLNYRDKETNKNIGATLIAVALTNRPFLEGMLPVVLSEELEGAFALCESTLDEFNRYLVAEDAYDIGLQQRLEALRNAYRAQVPASKDEYAWVVEVYETYVIAEDAGGLQSVPYIENEDGTFAFDFINATKVKRAFVAASEKVFAEWDAAYINDLPDSCFAYIKSGGEKDEAGKTVPRALRFLPYKDEDGSFDLPHWRKAMASLPQSSLTDEDKVRVKAALTKAAEKAGVDETGAKQKSTEKGATTMTDEEIRKLIGLDEDANVLDAVTALKAKADEAKELETKLAAETTKAEDATKTLREQEADALIAKALEDKKILPKQAEWAKNYCLTDRAGFDAYIENAAPVGPAEGELGTEAAVKAAAEAAITATERKVAKKLGVTDEMLVKQKEREAAAKAEAEEE